MKQCYRCHELKAPSEFGSNGHGGLHASCKACHSQRRREEYRKRHPINKRVLPEQIKCRICQEIKPRAEFPPNHGPDDLRTECTICYREIMRERRYCKGGRTRQDWLQDIRERSEKVLIENKKTCRTCGKEKPLTAFNKTNNGALHGYRANCKQCVKKAAGESANHEA